MTSPLHNSCGIQLMVSTLFALSLHATALAEESRYQGICDASSAIAIGTTHLLVAEDEKDSLLLYATDTPHPVKTFDFSSLMRTDLKRESDIEGSARTGNRIYWISSHGRNGKGKIRDNRYNLFATDISNPGATRLELNWVGSYKKLIHDALNRKSWEQPDSEKTAATIALLRAATRLHDRKDKSLAPKKNGLNIEALAALPNQQGLLIGLRNPLYQNRALVSHLKNADELMTQRAERARFGEPRYLELDGLGIRSMTYHRATKKFLIIAGEKVSGGRFKLFAWDYSNKTAPVFIRALQSSQGSHPEGLIVSGSQIHILHDEGSHLSGGKACKEAAIQDKGFSIHSYHY